MREYAAKHRTLSLWLKIGLVSLLVISLPSSGFAQERRLEITGFIGGLSITNDLGSIDNIYFTTTGAAEDISFFEYIGLRGAFFFTPYLGIEANLSSGTNRFTYAVDDRDLEAVDLGTQFEAKQLNYGGALIFQYPLDVGFVPYGTAGLGRQTTTPSNPIADIDSVTGFDFHFGGGAKYFFEAQDLPWLGLRFDLRFHYISDGLAFLGNEVSPRHTEFTIGGVIRPF